MHSMVDNCTVVQSNFLTCYICYPIESVKNTPDSLEYNFIFIKSMYIFYVFNIFATHAGF